MLEIIYGTDELAIRTATLAKVDELTVADQTRQVVRIEPATYAPGQLASTLATTSLFGGGVVCIIETPRALPALYEEVLVLASELAASSYYFFVLEGPLLVADKKKFPAATIFTEYKKTSLKNFDVFTLASALASKDKRTLWLTLMAAKQEGLSAEEIIGIFWWQLKTLQLASVTSSAAEAGIKDYPYNKAKQALRLFKAGELNRLLFSLLELYHDGHAGKRDIDLALEAWVLRG